MIAPFQDIAEFDRYLVIDDSDDDVTQILTVICESSGSRRLGCPQGFERGGVQ